MILYDKYLLCIIRVFEFLCSDIDYTCLEFFFYYVWRFVITFLVALKYIYPILLPHLFYRININFIKKLIFSTKKHLQTQVPIYSP